MKSKQLLNALAAADIDQAGLSLSRLQLNKMWDRLVVRVMSFVSSPLLHFWWSFGSEPTKMSEDVIVEPVLFRRYWLKRRRWEEGHSFQQHQSRP